MNVKAASLTNLSGEMSIEDLKVGSQLQYVGKGNKTFAVTFIEPPAQVKKRGGKSNKKNMPPQKQAEPSKQTEGLLQQAKNEVRLSYVNAWLQVRCMYTDCSLVLLYYSIYACL